MFKITVEQAAALVIVKLDGLIGADESARLCAELRQTLTSLRGRPIKILADARGLQPLSPEVADQFGAVQRFALSQGLERAAQVVESSVVLLQRTRIMRESGTDPKTRTFRDVDEARQWLLARDTLR